MCSGTLLAQPLPGAGPRHRCPQGTGSPGHPLGWALCPVHGPQESTPPPPPPNPRRRVYTWCNFTTGSWVSAPGTFQGKVPFPWLNLVLSRREGGPAMPSAAGEGRLSRSPGRGLPSSGVREPATRWAHSVFSLLKYFMARGPSRRPGSRLQLSGSSAAQSTLGFVTGQRILTLVVSQGTSSLPSFATYAQFGFSVGWCRGFGDTNSL